MSKPALGLPQLGQHLLRLTQSDADLRTFGVALDVDRHQFIDQADRAVGPATDLLQVQRLAIRGGNGDLGSVDRLHRAVDQVEPGDRPHGLGQ